jgi:folate-binding protein YgfZ
MVPQVATTSRDVVTVSGPDAATYLQGQLSQDVAGMAVGDTRWTFVLAPQGKVDGWGRIHRIEPERYSITVDDGAGAAWEARLRRFLLRTKAEIEVAESVPVVALRGVGSGALLEQLTGPAASGWQPAGWPGAEGFDRLSGSDHREVAAAVQAAGAEAIDDEALEAARIRAGVGAWGAEIDTETIPATLGQWAVDASVSFTKGCYTGQELVARIDSRGGNVPRSLYGVVVERGVPEVGAAVVVSGGADGGRTLGEVTTSAADGEGSVALVYVPRAVTVPDEGLDVQVGGAPGRVVHLPM